MRRTELLKKAVRLAMIYINHFVMPWEQEETWEKTFQAVFEDITENAAAGTLEMLEDMEDGENAVAIGLSVKLEMLNRAFEKEET